MESIGTLSAEVGALLRQKGLSLACAESLTGGLLASSIVAISGASDYFVGGVVSYRYSAKVALLDIDADLLEREGAINAEVAILMADSVREKLDADIALSTTGVAGPDADISGAQVGELFVGVSTAVRSFAEQYSFDENMSRDEIRLSAVRAALVLLKNHLSEM